MLAELMAIFPVTVLGVPCVTGQAAGQVVGQDGKGNLRFVRLGDYFSSGGSKSREEQQYLWGDAPTASLKVLHPQSGSGVYPAMTATLSFQTHGSSSRCSQIARIR